MGELIEGPGYKADITDAVVPALKLKHLADYPENEGMPEIYTAGAALAVRIEHYGNRIRVSEVKKELELTLREQYPDEYGSQERNLCNIVRLWMVEGVMKQVFPVGFAREIEKSYKSKKPSF